MPLTMAKVGYTLTIRRITGRDEVRQHLAELGFVVDAQVCVVNELGGNVVELAGTVVDVDDEWVLMEALDKKGHRRLIAMRLDQVAGINE